MPQYIRHRVPGGCYFFTVNLHNRTSDTLTRHIDLLRSAFKYVNNTHPFHIDAIVILPDHLHAIWTLPTPDNNYSTRWRLIKTQFTLALPKTESRSASRQQKHERGIWQRRFWEHTIKDENDYARHVDYIHYNPVKHGHVKRVNDWPYSSFHDYVKRGDLPLNWATNGLPFDADWN